MDSARERGRELLARGGLERRMGFLATNLSGGQKQGVAIARALMNQPEHVLAGQPIGNLDWDAATQGTELISE